MLVELLGLTPGLDVVFAGAEQPVNLPPPVLVWLFELGVAPVAPVAPALALVDVLAV